MTGCSLASEIEKDAMDWGYGMSQDLTRGQRFLDAFNRIETTLRERTRSDLKEAGFKELVRASRDLVDSQKRRLLDMANLRNVIVHTPFDQKNEIYADPRLSAVEWLEAQAELIEKPPRVLDVLRLIPPRVLSFDDEIDQFLEEAKPPKDFSQSPFRTSNGDFGVITTNAVARWLAAVYVPRDGLIVEPAHVGNVATYGEEQDRVLVKPRTLKVTDAIMYFSGVSHVPPVAILLTESGRHSESPLGICVRADLPDFYRSLGV